MSRPPTKRLDDMTEPDANVLPSTITPEKLREIAGWLDTYDKMGVQFIRLTESLVEKSHQLAPKGLLDLRARRAGKVKELLDIVRSSEVQDDLRAWADAIQEERE